MRADQGAPEPEGGRKIPSHEVTWARLRDMILFGHLAPGQPVTIQGLVEDLGAGMTPVREAIRRLAAAGALLPGGNRRVVVPPMTVETLDQLAFARLSLEPHLAELALKGMSGGLVTRLEALDASVSLALEKGDLPAYLRANHDFHFTLYEAAAAPVLLDLAHSLWLRSGPALRVVITRFGPEGLPDLHRAALLAMRAGDGAGLAAAIRADIDQGFEQIRKALTEGAL